MSKTTTTGNHTQRDATVVDAEEHTRDHDVVAGETEVVTTAPGPGYFIRGWLGFFQGAIAFALLTVLSALSFRLAFALAGANPANGFVNFIYDITAPLVAPFESIANEEISGDGVFEPETAIAMGVFTVAALLVIVFLGLLKSAPTPEHEEVTHTRHEHIDTHA